MPAEDYHQDYLFHNPDDGLHPGQRPAQDRSLGSGSGRNISAAGLCFWRKSDPTAPARKTRQGPDFSGYKPVTLTKIGLAGAAPVSFTVLIW